MPVLFIGSGISQRYCSLCGWDELLQKIANRIGLSKFQLNGIKSQLETENPDREINPKIASELSKLMHKMIAEGQITHKDFDDLSDEEWALMESVDPFKVLVAHFTSDLTLCTDPDIQKELESFKRISHKVPAIITTNYDEFLEKYIFTDFSVLLYPDDYYFNSSSGYDEILKIHGSTSRPESIVITEEDYQKLQQDSKVITSRLTSLMCQNPIIFLGYSISDEEIHNVILNLVSSLKQTDLDIIRGHLIRVSVRPNLRKTIWNPKTEILLGRKIEIMQLEVPNLDILYRYLDRFTPVASPHEIRKYQEMIREIVLSTDPTARKIELIDVENIDDAKPGDLAVIFGKSTSVSSMMKGILGYESKDALLDVLLNRTGGLDTSSTHFTEWLNQKRISKGKGFAPVFHYLLKYNIDQNKLNADALNYIRDLESKLEQKLEFMEMKCSSVHKKEDLPEFFSKQTKSFPKCEALAYFHFTGILTREECRRLLVEQYNDDRSKFQESMQMKTDLRAAITMLDYKEYISNRTETCTLSH